MEEGPWNFKGKAVVLAEYDGYTKPSLIKLETIEIWLQGHDLPDGFNPLLGSLAKKVGELVYTKPKNQDFEGNFYRARIKLNVCKPVMYPSLRVAKERFSG